MKKSIFILAILLLSGAIGSKVSTNESFASLQEATFVVAWYDVGKDALDGREGIVRVDKGMRNYGEINTVVFDPEKIQMNEMEEALKNAQTYIRTVPPNSDGNNSGTAQ